MSDAEDDVRREVEAIVNSDPYLRSLFTVSMPRYRYFSHGQRRFCWNTEPIPGKRGHWFAFEYRPTGKGARTCKATRWELVRNVRCGSRKAAKERARAWVQRAEQGRVE